MDLVLQLSGATLLEMGRAGGATLLTGLSIKLMDDLLDEPPWGITAGGNRADSPADRPEAGAAAGSGAGVESTPLSAADAFHDPLGGPGARACYALAALALAAAFLAGWAVSLFLAAYAVGMVGDHTRLPSGIPPWLEAAGALLLGAFLIGWVETAAAAGAMVAVQAVDDLIDRPGDLRRGSRNWTRRLGRSGTALLALTGLLQTAILIPRMAIWVALCVPLIERGLRKCKPVQGRQYLDSANRSGTLDRLLLTPVGIRGRASTREGRGVRSRGELRTLGDAQVRFGAGKMHRVRSRVPRRGEVPRTLPARRFPGGGNGGAGGAARADRAGRIDGCGDDTGEPDIRDGGGA